MEGANQPLRALQDIRSMMERSSRFISLSGWSGISAGTCALVGALIAAARLKAYNRTTSLSPDDLGSFDTNIARGGITTELLLLAAAVFIAAFVSAFLFTYFRSKKTGVPVWGRSAMRLMWNTVLPMVAGGLVVLRMLELGHYSLVAPCTLIFYGLALVNGSKYTLGEVKYMGYGQIILGICNLWLPNNGLLFWAAGFGVLHIVYGGWMWWKYERGPETRDT